MKTLKYQDLKYQYQKSYKASFVIYGDLECIINKIDGCKNNPETSSTKKRKIFYQIFQNLYLHLEVQKISMMYTEVKIV